MHRHVISACRLALNQSSISLATARIMSYPQACFVFRSYLSPLNNTVLPIRLQSVTLSHTKELPWIHHLPSSTPVHKPSPTYPSPFSDSLFMCQWLAHPDIPLKRIPTHPRPRFNDISYLSERGSGQHRTPQRASICQTQDPLR